MIIASVDILFTNDSRVSVVVVLLYTGVSLYGQSVKQDPQKPDSLYGLISYRLTWFYGLAVFGSPYNQVRMHEWTYP